MPRLTARVVATLASLALAWVFVVISPSVAFACSCRGLSIQSALQRADAVFQGRVLDLQTVRKPEPGRTDIRFEVSRVFKGTVFRHQIVASPRGADGCGIDAAVDSQWVIFAEETVEGSGDDAVFRLATQVCNGSVASSTVPTALGRGQPPLGGASDREERAVNTDATFTRVLKGAALVAGALAVALGCGLAFLWRPGRSRSNL